LGWAGGDNRKKASNKKGKEKKPSHPASILFAPNMISFSSPFLSRNQPSRGELREGELGERNCLCHFLFFRWAFRSQKKARDWGEPPVTAGLIWPFLFSVPTRLLRAEGGKEKGRGKKKK